MAVEITVTSGTGSLGDVITGWSVNEATTPADPSRQTANTGSVNFAAKTETDSAFIVDDVITFTHETLGTIKGIVNDITITDNVVSGTIAKNAALLDVERTMPPTASLPLSDIITNYVAAVTNQLTVNYTATNNPTKVFPGWTGSVWAKLNELCALNDLEIVIVNDTIVIRDMGISEYEIKDHSEISRTISTRAAGLYVDIVYQNSQFVSSDSTYKWNYSTNPSLENNSTGWSGSVSNGTATIGRVTN